MNEITVKPLTPELLEDYLEFFDHRAFTDNPEWSACYCLFPYHDPGSGDFDERTAGENRAAIVDAVNSGLARGFLAYAGGQVVGWCSAAPRASFPAMRGFPGEGDAIGATPCFVIQPGWRRRGVARKLLLAACDAMREAGMQTMEAAPMREAHTEASNSRGPLAMYLAQGYHEVADVGGAVVVEKKLQAGV